MKFRYLLFIIGLCSVLVSCYKDEGNYDYIDLPDIEIKAEDKVSATQFTTLNIPVEVNIDGASKDDYEYYWRIWSNGIDNNGQKVIGRTKDLSYKVDEIPGSYNLVLTCHNKRTGVDVYKEITLTVQGVITEGWLVLQERNNKTDFDLIMTPYFSERVKKDNIIQNLYESVNGEPLDGRGVKIGSYSLLGRYQYVTVLTDKGGARLDAVTMQKAFDMSTLMRDGKKWKPENYIFWNYQWTPARFGFDAIVSDGRFYEYSPIDPGFTSYTEPILKDGMTYKASPYAPKWFDYYQGIIFDELRGGFICIAKNTWVLQEMPEPVAGQPFDYRNLHGTLKYMDTGFNNYEYGVIEDWDTHKRTLYVFNFDTKKNIAIAKYSMENCPELDNCKTYAVGSRGPIFYYATDKRIYLYDYSGSNTAKVVYTLAANDEKITGMKILKPLLNRLITTHPYDNKVLIISTYNETKKEGKIYMYYINESNGIIDTSSEKVFNGFGEIIDMDYNWAKYGS